MSKQSIFEKLKKSLDYKNEILRIEEILKANIVSVCIDRLCGRYRNYRFEDFISEYIFLDWNARETCLNCEDMREVLEINKIVDNCRKNKEITVEQLLDYFEYAVNILLLWSKVYDKRVDYKINKEVHRAALNNIQNILNKLNFEIKLIEKEDKIIIVEKNPAATAVAEIVDENIADEVIQYNHYLLKGDIETKKKCLLSLGNQLEPQRNQIKSLNSKLEANIFFMLNNLNLRHNNCDVNDEKRYNKFVDEMSKEILEEYYDELYQMILLAFLLIDNIKRTKEIENLKTKIGGQQ